MIELVRTLRGMTDAGTADYTIAGFEYWTDDHPLNIMDRYRVEVYREHL